MRRCVFLTAIGAAVLAVAPLSAAAAATTASRQHHTERTVIRPVTSTGHAAHGYRVRTFKDDEPIDCSAASPSAAAVDDDIVECAPTVADALACWRSAEPRRVLCLDDARKKVLTKFRTTGPIAHVEARHRRFALNLELADGVYCSLRDGGAANHLRQHPSWSLAYYCTHGKAVWSSPSQDSIATRHGGQVGPVEVASDSGKKHVHAVRVSRAWLVGTRH